MSSVERGIPEGDQFPETEQLPAEEAAQVLVAASAPQAKPPSISAIIIIIIFLQALDIVIRFAIMKIESLGWALAPVQVIFFMLFFFISGQFISFSITIFSLIKL
jgi:hypothetical protein